MEVDEICVVEGVATALVKEFLQKKGCQETLECFRLELPENGVCDITNRKSLIKTLELEDLYNKNKTRKYPYKSVLEIITGDILYRVKFNKSEPELPISKSPAVSPIVAWTTPKSSFDQFLETKSVSSSSFKRIKQRTNTEKSSAGSGDVNLLESDPVFLNSSDARNVKKHVTSISSPYPVSERVSSILSPNPRERRRIRSTEELNRKVFLESDIIGEPPVKDISWNLTDLQSYRTAPKRLFQRSEEADLSTEMSMYNSSYRYLHGVSSSVRLLSPDNYSCVRPINVDEACELRILLFGNTKRTFGEEWSEQGFSFNDSMPVAYGISQKRAGPCGVLAAVQAHVIRELLFGTMNVQLSSGFVRPTVQERREALARALTHILWQAGEGKQVIFAVKNDHMVLSSDVVPHLLRGDGVVENLNLRVFESEEYLLEYLFNVVPGLEDHENGGCVTFLYSVLLTRGIENIKEDMDNPESHLIGTDGYASQEIVNLLLIGRAVSNVFDGDKELRSDGTDRIILRGIPAPSKIGQLSLYEYNNTCRVGNFYKNPIHPIWLVLSENHFTILFATSHDILDRKVKNDSFQLFVYDGLSKDRKEKRITLEPTGGRQLVPGTEDDYLPALERCIRTRWRTARVTWES